MADKFPYIHVFVHLACPYSLKGNLFQDKIHALPFPLLHHKYGSANGYKHFKLTIETGWRSQLIDFRDLNRPIEHGHKDVLQTPPALAYQGDTIELEPCIGCMQTSANIKLVKNCHEPNEGECQQCYCRPMWCLTCMGKWFASRQDQQHPETWLSSQVPCPTCRAKFCIVDVCIVR
ncbi:hypothetical protein AB205_0138330 [Aquarana catesbeiana]|uniref:Uncharacterized protein n=1 Tax=Aquarana catesbeiana TaxID=8400 RepID=A0A2G9QDJ9_AQUCT|nr:hypothetical protein AB205_0138330 [Aquarana catesbeiana]